MLGMINKNVKFILSLINNLHFISPGRTTFESNRSIGLYNLGWKQNMLEVFGDGWKKAFIWPFTSSKLPHNGVDWDTTETWGLEGPKHR